MSNQCDKHTHTNTCNERFFRIINNSVWLFLVALIWLVFRSSRRPSRIAYPCQQAAASVVLTSLAAALVICRRGIIKFLRKIVWPHLTLKRISFITLSSLALIYGAGRYQVYRSWTRYDLNKISGPIGIRLDSTNAERALFATIPAAMAVSSPHRVVSVHNSASTSWTGSGSPHDYLNQEEVRKMVRRGILSLSGKSDYVAAWQDIIPYQTGEIVGIKVNCNNGCYLTTDRMNPYAELVNAVIEGLTSMGIPANRIWLIDPSRNMGNDWRTRITNPDVVFAPNGHTYVTGNSPYSSTANFTREGPTPVRPGVAFTKIHHLINMPQLKGHGGASITLGLKNHFGSVEIGAQGREHWHDYMYQYKSPYGTNGINPILAINLNPQLKDKTRLIIGDGLFGHPSINFVAPVLFRSFGNNPPEILFFGVDPMAVDSVMLDYLQRECRAAGIAARAEDLHVDAANAGLGVMEHWDGDDTRRYSAIEYLEIDLDNSSPGYNLGDVSGDGGISAYDTVLVSLYAVGLTSFTAEQIQAADVSGNGTVSAYDAALIARYVAGLLDQFPSQ